MKSAASSTSDRLGGIYDSLGVLESFSGRHPEGVLDRHDIAFVQPLFGVLCPVSGAVRRLVGRLHVPDILPETEREGGHGGPLVRPSGPSPLLLLPS